MTGFFFGHSPLLFADRASVFFQYMDSAAPTPGDLCGAESNTAVFVLSS
jgi:hypothetical protein